MKLGLTRQRPRVPGDESDVSDVSDVNGMAERARENGRERTDAAVHHAAFVSRFVFPVRRVTYGDAPS